MGSSMQSLVWTVLAAALMLGGRPGGPAPLPAQDAGSPPRGWIGVGLKAGDRCPAAGQDPCGPAVVGSVILGGPAARAGIQPGDTLLAVSERRIRRGPDDPAFRAIRAGEPVTVRVARDGERIRLRVTPRTPPDSLAVIRVRAPDPPPAPGQELPWPAPSPGYVLALPDTAREAERPVVRLVPVGRAGELTRVLGHARAEALRAAMAEARARMARRDEGLAAARRIAREMELQAARMAAEQWRSWVDDSLKARLDAVHDSVLSRARQQLEAMIEARARQRRGARLRTFPTRGASRDRIAGAELQGLNPELSDFFGGLEHGVLVLRVLPRTPAAELGLRPGDVIVGAAGRRVTDAEDLRQVLRGAGDGRGVEVKWVRKGRELTGRLRP